MKHYKLIFLLILLVENLLIASPTQKTIQAISTQEKKQHFFAFIIPAVYRVYKELHENYEDLKKLAATNPQDKKVLALLKTYKANNIQELLEKLKPHPRSITIAQAAIESAWGRSRFATVANNYFGIWSINPNEPRIAASQKRGTKTIYLKKYASIDDSIKDYYKLLATGKAFKQFRKRKMQTDDPYTLVRYLENYSEKGSRYTKWVKNVIRHNNLTKYDFPLK